MNCAVIILHEFYTNFMLSKLTIFYYFAILSNIIWKEKYLNMDESDSDSEENQFNRIFNYISQGVVYVYKS